MNAPSKEVSAYRAEGIACREAAALRDEALRKEAREQHARWLERFDARTAMLSAKYDADIQEMRDTRAEVRSTRTTIVITVVAAALSTLVSVAGLNALLLAHFTSAFDISAKLAAERAAFTREADRILVQLRQSQQLAPAQQPPQSRQQSQQPRPARPAPPARPPAP